MSNDVQHVYSLFNGFFLAALQNSIQDPDLLAPLGHGSKNGNGSSLNLITATSEFFVHDIVLMVILKISFILG